MPPLRVGAGKQLQKLRHLSRTSWPKNEMPMVRHDAVCKETDAYDPSHLEEKVLHGDIALCGLEEAHPGRSPIDHVIDEFAYKYWAPGHLVLP
jgi:hypothetical protein